MTHKHHIDPKHSGGEPNGLTVELTIEEHAEEHRLLWIKEGREYDRIAWLALSKHIGKEEAFLLALNSPERRKKISEKLERQRCSLDERKSKRKNTKRKKTS